MALTNKDLWAQYVNAVAGAQGMPGADNLVITGTAMPASFNTHYKIDDKKPKKADAAFQLFSLADPLALQDGVYKPSGQSFFSDYATYIDNLNPQGKAPTPLQAKNLAANRKALANAIAAYDKDLDKANKDYQKQTKLFPGKWDTFADWLASSPSSATVQADLQGIAGRSTKLSALNNEIFGKDYVAIDANRRIVDQVRSDLIAANPQNKAEMSVRDGLKNKFVKPLYTIGSLQTYSDWVKGNLAKPPKNPAAKYEFSATAGQYNFSKSTYFKQTSWGVNFFFFSVGGSSTESRTQVDINTSEQSLKGSIEFQAITQIAGIGPGPWYDSSLMYDWTSPLGGKNLSLPYVLAIALKPKITLKFDAKNFQSAYSAYSKSGSFGVGVFIVFHDKTNYSESDVRMNSTWDSSSNTVTIEQDGNQPIIIGMGMKMVEKGGIK